MGADPGVALGSCWSPLCAPQLPCSIPAHTWGCSSTKFLLQCVGFPRDPAQLRCCALSSAQSSQLSWLWLPSQPDFWNDSAQGINKMEFPGGEAWAAGEQWEYQQPAVTAQDGHYLAPHVIKATNQSHWIHLFSPHSLAFSGEESFESSWSHVMGSPNYPWVSAVKSDSRYSSNLKSENLCQTLFQFFVPIFLLQRFVWKYW